MANPRIVTVDGIAADAKRGAVVLVNDIPYYLSGLDRWPRALLGTRVRASGRLVYLPGDEPNPNTQYMVGPVRVLEEPCWATVGTSE